MRELVRLAQKQQEDREKQLIAARQEQNDLEMKLLATEKLHVKRESQLLIELDDLVESNETLTEHLDSVKTTSHATALMLIQTQEQLTKVEKEKNQHEKEKELFKRMKQVGFGRPISFDNVQLN